MTMGRIFFLIGLALGAIAFAPTDARADPIVTLPTRPEVTQRFALLKPDGPVASVILFAGGPGKVPLDKLEPGQFINRGNFLVRVRYEFQRHGFMVAIVDAPSDRQSANGMEGSFRGSPEHARDIAAVIDYLKAQANVPLWIVGTSRGTESVASLATKLGERIDGAVFTSSMTSWNRAGLQVFDFPLDTVRVPALVVAHAEDGCSVTPPSGAERIKNALVKSPRTQVLYFEGGDPPKSDPCEALSAHGFLGIEKKVVAAIADFIKGK